MGGTVQGEVDCRPSFTSIVNFVFPRCTTSSIVSPGLWFAMTSLSLLTVGVETPSAPRMMSPPIGHVSPATSSWLVAPFKPAFAAPLPG